MNNIINPLTGTKVSNEWITKHVFPNNGKSDRLENSMKTNNWEKKHKKKRDQKTRHSKRTTTRNLQESGIIRKLKTLPQGSPTTAVPPRSRHYWYPAKLHHSRTLLSLLPIQVSLTAAFHDEKKIPVAATLPALQPQHSVGTDAYWS